MASQPASAFGHLLRRLREAAGLSQAELAERAGLSREAISVLERAADRSPRRDTVALLADALGLDDEARARFAAAARARPATAVSSGAPPRGAPPLVDRGRELARLSSHLAAGGPPLLLLAGDPGIGKSRLLREAAARAAAAGWAVVRGGCARDSGQEPYAPLPAALADHLLALPRARRRTALRGGGTLARLLPEMLPELDELDELDEPGPVPAPGWASGQARRLLFAAVERLLAALAGPSGVLLVLDDLQWAGADAFELLAALARATAAPVRLLGAYRATEVDARHPLATTLADLARDGLAEQLALGPLAPDEARALLAGLLGPEAAERPAADRLIERAGGVPFYLVSGARALAAAGASAEEAERVPEDVAQSVRQRVALLPEAAGDLLQIAAAAGRGVELATLEAVAGRLGQEPAVTLRALEATLRARLLREDGEAGYYFVHDLVWETIAADLSAARRLFLHGQIAEALEGRLPEAERRRRAAELAWHFARAGRPGRALACALLAGDDAAAVYAHADAVRHYRLAAEQAAAAGDDAMGRLARAKLAAALPDAR